MRPVIKNEKLYYLAIPGKIEKVVLLILKDFNATPEQALIAFYKSPTYEKLNDPKTGFWKSNTRNLYEDFLLSTKRKNKLSNL